MKLSSEHPQELATAKGMPYGRFALTTGLQLGAALFIYWLIAPAMFASEFSRTWQILYWTAVIGVPLSLFEYLYHRYMLHSAVLPFLGSMHKAHTHHHGLTNVKAAVTPKEPARTAPVENEYPIEHEHQEDDMMFPVYAVSIFYVVFLALFAVPLKLIFPAAPIVASTLFCVTLCVSAYEVWHAITHLSYEKWWKPKMNHRVIGGVTRHAYGFHLMHHWRPSCNLAVVGLWGFAVWDHIFGTHRRPERLPLAGNEVRFVDCELRKPRFPIGLLDKIGKRSYKLSRSFERMLVRLFSKRRTAE